jgi:copper chaperone CopZ
MHVWTSLPSFVSADTGAAAAARAADEDMVWGEFSAAKRQDRLPVGDGGWEEGREDSLSTGVPELKDGVGISAPWLLAIPSSPTVALTPARDMGRVGEQETAQSLSITHRYRKMAEGGDGGAAVARTTLNVQMTCGGCVKKCTELLRAVPGVVDVATSLESKTIVVTHNASATPEGLVTALEPWSKGKPGRVALAS